LDDEFVEARFAQANCPALANRKHSNELTDRLASTTKISERRPESGFKDGLKDCSKDYLKKAG
jgi:hypothetical protein